MANSYNSAQAFQVARHFRFKNGVNVQAMTGAKTLTYKDSMFQVLNPDASYDVTLPAEKNGAVFFIRNEDAGSNALTIKDDAAATIATIAAGEGAIFCCDGSDWKLVIKA